MPGAQWTSLVLLHKPKVIQQISLLFQQSLSYSYSANLWRNQILGNFCFLWRSPIRSRFQQNKIHIFRLEQINSGKNPAKTFASGWDRVCPVMEVRQNRPFWLFHLRYLHSANFNRNRLGPLLLREVLRMEKPFQWAISQDFVPSYGLFPQNSWDGSFLPAAVFADWVSKLGRQRLHAPHFDDLFIRGFDLLHDLWAESLLRYGRIPQGHNPHWKLRQLP